MDHAVLAYLRSLCGYRNLYTERGQEGWLTTSLTRPVLLEGLVSLLLEHPGLINSRRLLGGVPDVCEGYGGESGGSAGDA